MATGSARRFDLVEGALALVFVMMLSFGMGLRFGTVQFPAIGFVHPQDRLAGEALARRFGPTHHSGGPEEWIVRDTFQDERGGVFADIGAWQPVTGSNTYYLEHVLGWTGLAVDALPNHAAEWRRERPRSQFVQAFVDNTDGRTRRLHISDTHESVSSGSADFVALFARPNRTITVSTSRLDSLLERANITRLDYLTMDIELSEPSALAGFSIERFTPRLVCVEALAPVRQQILNYFAVHGYVVIGKYLRLDTMNLYFAPVSAMDDRRNAVAGE